MTIKLIATDMDGTFLDGDGRYNHDRLDAVLTQLAHHNITFVAASGRQLLALEAMFADFTDRMIFVAENGGIVKHGQTILFEEQMAFDKVLEISEFVRQSDYITGDAVLLSGANGSYILDTASAYYQTKVAHYYENVQVVSNFSEVSDDILKLTVNFTPERVLEGEAWLNAHVTGVRGVTTGFESIDIMPAGISKATGLAHLAEKFGIHPSEMMAFGDNLNDFEMMTYAGHAVAPENARVEIKQVADDLIADHATASVMTYLEAFVARL